MDHHFPKENKLTKIFNKTTIKVIYYCTQKLPSIIKFQTHKITEQNVDKTPPCNCRNKQECPLEGNCQIGGILYKYTAGTSEELSITARPSITIIVPIIPPLKNTFER